MKYRKGNITVEAFRLNERGLVGEDWFWDAVSENIIITHDFGKFHSNPAWCEIKTLEGIMTAQTGDYIVRNPIIGEIFACSAEDFEKAYKAV